MKLRTKLASLPVPGLTRVACVLALLGLAAMVTSVLVPRPLPVIFAMSVGHCLGALALICYVLAVVLDAARGRSNPE